ncbi:MAG: hypothetical protein Q9173_002571 [Seirophora scorigena]
MWQQSFVVIHPRNPQRREDQRYGIRDGGLHFRERDPEICLRVIGWETATLVTPLQLEAYILPIILRTRHEQIKNDGGKLYKWYRHPRIAELARKGIRPVSFTVHTQLQEAKAAAVTPGADTKVAEDKQSSGDTTRMPDEKVEIGYKVGSKSHGRKTIMLFDPPETTWRQETPKTEDYATTKVKKDSDPETQCAFVFTEYYKEQSGGDRAYDFSEIDIFSKELISKLKETLGDRARIWDGREESLRSPYHSMVYCWDKLAEQTMVSEEPHIPGSGPESERARETREALADLLECIRTTQELKEYFKTRDTDIARQVTFFKYLWAFSPPATTVVASPFMDTPQLFLVEALKQKWSDLDNREPRWQMDCIYLDFDTSFSRRMVWNSDLIINEDKKKIIRTLVENHAQMAHKRVPDLVEGKGNGLVILLHGPPGVGKSLTAECVAKATLKPLFTVDIADIGTDSKTVEDKLNKLFLLAAEWDAVLLIDAADVFMEQ